MKNFQVTKKEGEKRAYPSEQVEQEILAFLKKNWDEQKGPLLLALSGGFDSMALFHLLLKARLFLRFDLEILHVDHQWRESSCYEAKTIEELCLKEKLSFHKAVLDSSLVKSEELAREKRLKFYKKIYKKVAAQALFMAHHADDCSETILKKIFEGTSLLNLRSIESRSEFEKMQIWRPLHKTPKKILCAYLEKRGIEAFDDATNRDLFYLRARMREKILPYLRGVFAKNIEKNLCYLSEESAQLRKYFEAKFGKHLQPKDDVKGLFWDNVLEICEKNHFVLRQFIILITQKQGLTLSRQEIQKIGQALLDRRGGIFVQRGHTQVSVSKGKIYLIRFSLASYN